MNVPMRGTTRQYKTFSADMSVYLIVIGINIITFQTSSVYSE